MALRDSTNWRFAPLRLGGSLEKPLTAPANDVHKSPDCLVLATHRLGPRVAEVRSIPPIRLCRNDTPHLEFGPDTWLFAAWSHATNGSYHLASPTNTEIASCPWRLADNLIYLTSSEPQTYRLRPHDNSQIDNASPSWCLAMLAHLTSGDSPIGRLQLAHGALPTI